MEQKLTLKQIIPELKEVREAASALPEDYPAEIRTEVQGRRYAALNKLPELAHLHKLAFQRDSVAILIDTPESEFGTLVEIAAGRNFITVDAQGFYRALLDIPTIQGTEKFTNEAFMTTINRLRELAKKVGKQLPFFEAPKFEAHDNLSFEDNARGNLRALIGRSGPESTWTFVQGLEAALRSYAEGPMVPVLVYNLKGMSKVGYEDSFFNVEEISVDKMTEDSLKEALGEVQARLQSAGKLPTKRKQKEKQTEQGEANE